MGRREIVILLHLIQNILTIKIFIGKDKYGRLAAVFAMSPLVIGTVIAATSLALILVGGGAYEFLVVNPFWPKRPDLIQPNRGGISRKRFWIPAHVAFELSLMAALVSAWSFTEIRWWLWVALGSHVLMRLWSALDFIPKALAFERAEPGVITEASARKWSRRRMLRMPLDLVTVGAMLTAFVTVIRGM